MTKLYEFEIVEVIRHTFRHRANTIDEAREHAQRTADKLTIEQPGWPKGGRLGYAIGVKYEGCTPSSVVKEIEPIRGIDLPEPEG